MNRLTFIVFIIYFLVGCVNTDPVLNRAPITLKTEAELAKYWISNDTSHKNLEMNKKQKLILKHKDVYVMAQFLIDSVGKVHEVTVIDSNVEDEFGNMVRRALNRRRYEPAKTNPQKKPVYAVSFFRLSKIR